MSSDLLRFVKQQSKYITTTIGDKIDTGKTHNTIVLIDRMFKTSFDFTTFFFARNC